MKGRGLLSNPLVMAVIGLGVGAFLGLGLGAGLLLAVSGEAKSFETPPVAERYDIQAVVEETYINRILVENASGMTGGFTITAGELDLKPGGVGDFKVQVEVGPMSPVVQGRVGFRPNDDGSSLEVVLLSVEFGELQLASLLPGSLLDGANVDIQRLIVDKIGAYGLKVIGLESDETTLKLQFGRE